MTETKNLNIAVIGIGDWGKNILRNLYELNVVRKVCDTDVNIIEKRKKEFPELHYTTNTDDVIDDPNITAVAISTPSKTHYQLVKQALLANKDVFVEKPLALNYIHGKELVNLAKAKNRILMVGHILQYHPAVIKLKEIIGRGELGKIQYIYSNRLNIGKLRIEENILWSFAPHDISVILMLIGSEPIKISCFGESYINKDIFDVTLTTLEFNNETKAHIFVSWLHPFKEQKLVAVGSKAMAVFDDLTQEKLFIYPHKIEWDKGKIPVVHKAEYYCIDFERREPLKEEMKHFIECVSKRTKPKTDGEEALTVLKVLEQAEKSISKRGATLPISEDKKYYIHPTAVIDDNVEIGEGTKIWHFSHILPGTKIGQNCIIGQNVMIGPDVKIGNNCKIQNNVSIYKAVTLEDEVFCGPSCVFTNVYNPRAFIERKNEFLPTLVKKGVSIGANATIVCGTAIGRYAFIGAGAVVKKDVPDYALVVGIPARQIGWICKCGVPFKKISKNKTATCKNCGSKYSLKKSSLVVIKETL